LALYGHEHLVVDFFLPLRIIQLLVMKNHVLEFRVGWKIEQFRLLKFISLGKLFFLSFYKFINVNQFPRLLLLYILIFGVLEDIKLLSSS
jgi:hypothetical protein